MELEVLAKKALPEGIELYSIRLYPASGGFHFEIQLDGLNDPRGGVSLDDCEKFSRKFTELVDLELAAREVFAGAEDLAEDNYTMEVSSAGAERELRLPGDLTRFRGLPLKIVYQDGDRKKTIHAVYQGSGDLNGSEKLSFTVYKPGRGKSKKENIKNTEKKENELIQISSGDIVRINLFLDF